MNNTTEKTAQIAHYPFVEVHMCATRDEYLRVLRACDLNVTNSVHETFCISAIESMALGQPLVAPNGVTFPQITGGSPYLFSSEGEQKEILRKLLTNRELREDVGRRLSEHVRASYNNTLWAERYAELFEELTEKVIPGTKGETLERVADCLKENSGKTTRQVYNAVQKIRNEDGSQPLPNQSCSMTRLVRLARKVGGRVVMEKGEQRIYA